MVTVDCSFAGHRGLMHLKPRVSTTDDRSMMTEEVLKGVLLFSLMFFWINGTRDSLWKNYKSIVKAVAESFECNNYLGSQNDRRIFLGLLTNGS